MCNYVYLNLQLQDLNLHLQRSPSAIYHNHQLYPISICNSMDPSLQVYLPQLTTLSTSICNSVCHLYKLQNFGWLVGWYGVATDRNASVTLAFFFFFFACVSFHVFLFCFLHAFLFMFFLFCFFCTKNQKMKKSEKSKNKRKKTFTESTNQKK